MFFLRLIGGWSILAGVVALVADVTRAYESGGKLAFSSLGKDWYAISPATLNMLQAGIERHVHPALWDPVMLNVLKAPAFGVLAGLGVVLYIIGLRHRRTNIYAN